MSHQYRIPSTTLSYFLLCLTFFSLTGHTTTAGVQDDQQHSICELSLANDVASQALTPFEQLIEIERDELLSQIEHYIKYMQDHETPRIQRQGNFLAAKFLQNPPVATSVLCVGTSLEKPGQNISDSRVTTIIRRGIRQLRKLLFQDPIVTDYRASKDQKTFMRDHDALFELLRPPQEQESAVDLIE